MRAAGRCCEHIFSGGGDPVADLQRTMGAVIRRERHERDLTLKALAERSALSVVYLGEIERGKKYPSALVLERLAGALDPDPSALLARGADGMRAADQPPPAGRIGFPRPAPR